MAPPLLPFGGAGVVVDSWAIDLQSACRPVMPVTVIALVRYISLTVRRNFLASTINIAVAASDNTIISPKNRSAPIRS